MAHGRASHVPARTAISAIPSGRVRKISRQVISHERRPEHAIDLEARAHQRDDDHEFGKPFGDFRVLQGQGGEPQSGNGTQTHAKADTDDREGQWNTAESQGQPGYECNEQPQSHHQKDVRIGWPGQGFEHVMPFETAPKAGVRLREVKGKGKSGGRTTYGGKTPRCVRAANRDAAERFLSYIRG